MDTSKYCVILIDGTFVDVSSLKVGDVLMGRDSKPRTIKSIESSLSKVYKITPIDSPEDAFEIGENDAICMKYNTIPSQIRLEEGKFPRYKIKYTIPDAMKWRGIYLYQERITSKNFSITQRSKEEAYANAVAFREKLLENYEDPIHETTVKEYLGYSKSFKHRLVLYRSEGIEFPYRRVKMDPYLIGVWLGDGDSVGTIITTIDQEIRDYLYQEAHRLKLSLIQGKETEHHKGHLKYRFAELKEGNSFLDFLKEEKLIKNKHIPEKYKINTREVRLKMLAGLLDTDGHYGNESFYEIYQKNKRLADDIVFLARSLGFWAHIRSVKKGCWYKGEYKEGTYQKVTLGGMGLDQIPVLLPRKKAKKQEGKKQKNFLYTKFSVEEVGERETVQFTFKEGPSGYLLDNFIEMFAP